MLTPSELLKLNKVIENEKRNLQSLWINDICKQCLKRSGSGVVAKKEWIACERLNLGHKLLALGAGLKFIKEDFQCCLVFNWWKLFKKMIFRMRLRFSYDNLAFLYLSLFIGLPFFLIKVTILFLLLNFLLLARFIPSSNFSEVSSIPIFILLKSINYQVKLLLHCILLILLPILNIVQTYCYSHFSISTSSANSVPKSIIAFSIEEDD